ncbi:uncharacterized protein LOC110199956 [Phascolarctos cinereus]|uniref:Uncharacterized protein LOC110199956 n=1 Tax=Phascolarctos cinereus TaxID=38626 RepID=A0A6P5JB81_PHACI|nr:uncharacterized protein LOC110199956 [Phascolarctos cinereus]
MQSFDDLTREIQWKEESKQKTYTLGKSYDTISGKIVTMTGKAKEGEKAGEPSTLEALQKFERGMTESVKIIPVMTEYEVLEAISDDKARRGSEVQIVRRKLSESLAPIKEAESRLPSPDEECLKKTQKLEKDLEFRTGLGSIQPTGVGQTPDSEALKAGFFARKEKSPSEWRYSREPGFTIATAHYVNESSASRVVVTSDSYMSCNLKNKAWLFLEPYASTLNLSVSSCYLALC